MLINAGFDNLELSVRLPADAARAPVTVSFPEGRLIGLAKERLPVDITVAGSRPLAFSAVVDFLDEEGRAFGLRVTAAVDSCCLSTAPFMQVGQAQPAGSRALRNAVRHGSGLQSSARPVVYQQFARQRQATHCMLAFACCRGSPQANAGRLQLSAAAAGPSNILDSEAYEMPMEEAIGPMHLTQGVCRYLSAMMSGSWAATKGRGAAVADGGGASSRDEAAMLRQWLAGSRGRGLLELIEVMGGRAVILRVSCEPAALPQPC